ncbi:MAG: hypothetical protein ACE5MI_01130 [Acidimicrobiia bacterium]
MRSPLGPLAALDQALLVRRAAAATAVTFLIQFATGWALRNPVAPYGIVSLELAGSADRAEEIVASWEEANILGLATANVLLDYSFLVSYAVLLVALSVRAGMRVETPVSMTTGYTVGWGQWLAGGLDAVENVALLVLLAGAISDLTAGIARAAAVGKFVLIGVGLLWVVTAEVVRLVRR